MDVEWVSVGDFLILSRKLIRDTIGHLRLVYMYRQSHRFLYRLKIGSMPAYSAIYNFLKKIKGAAYKKNGDVNGKCNEPLELNFLKDYRWSVHLGPRTDGHAGCRSAASPAHAPLVPCSSDTVGL